MIETVMGILPSFAVPEGIGPDGQKLVAALFTVMIVTALACFAVSELTRNYSQVDKLWSIMPAVYSWIAWSGFPSARTFLMALLVTVWGARLSYNFNRKGGYNIIPWHGEEDYRWKIMRDKPLLKGRFRFGLFNLLFISFYQHFLILLFTSPVIVAAVHGDTPVGVTDIAAAILMLTFIVTEGIADNQLFSFHLQKKGSIPADGRFTRSIESGFMRDGLWKYTRHPNFLAEQAVWITFYFFGVSASGNLLNLTVAGPVLLVLLFAGSISLTESISGNKYPAYAVYRKEVPRLIPNLFRSR